jgi:hypothetical protein
LLKCVLQYKRATPMKLIAVLPPGTKIYLLL